MNIRVAHEKKRMCRKILPFLKDGEVFIIHCWCQNRVQAKQPVCGIVSAVSQMGKKAGKV